MRLLFRGAAAFLTPNFRAAAGCAGEPRQGHCARGSSGAGTVRRAVSTTLAAEALIHLEDTVGSEYSLNTVSQTIHRIKTVKSKIIESYCIIILLVLLENRSNQRFELVEANAAITIAVERGK